LTPGEVAKLADFLVAEGVVFCLEEFGPINSSG